MSNETELKAPVIQQRPALNEVWPGWATLTLSTISNQRGRVRIDF